MGSDPPMEGASRPAGSALGPSSSDGDPDEGADAAPRGFVFAVTGAGYLAAAIPAARSVAATNPGVPIDLFADRPCDDSVFARVHPLERDWFRPKFEALRRSRFERTIYLDCDVRVVAPLGDVFALLERFDLAAAHDQYRNARRAVVRHGEPVPAAFPQVNSGVIGVRASEATRRLMAEVEADLAASGAGKDQPVLRAHLWRSDLRLAILPEEYNLMAYRQTLMWTDARAAPRVIHSPRLKTVPGPDLAPLTGGRIARHVGALLAADRTLGEGPRRRLLAPLDRTPAGWLMRLGEAVGRRVARLRGR
jgi:hypothetical protein